MSSHSQNIGRVSLVVYLIAVLYLCLGNFSGVSGMWKTLWGIQMDKIIHFWMFLPYPILAYWSFHNKRSNSTTLLLKILLLGIVGSGVIELMQALFTDSRSAQWGDWLANTTGMFLSTILTALVLLLYHRCQKK